MKVIALFTGCFLLFTCNSFGQYFTIDTVKGVSPYYRDVSYIFPHLISSKSQKVADMINRDLMVSILNVDFDIDSGKQYKNIFEKVWGDSTGSIISLSDISFEVLNNDSLFVCIGISAEGCGAYCEHWTRYFTVDSRSGLSIGIDEFFNGNGLPLLLSYAKTKKNKRIEENIIRLKRRISENNTLEKDRDNAERAIEIYSDCEKPGGDSEYEELSFSISKNQLTLYLNPCLPHVIRALDDVDYNISFEWKDLKFLSDYGKVLLNL